MKKLVVGILLATMLVIGGYAEDYASMSVDELLEARAAIDQALYELGNMTVLLPGEYLVGEDIPAGRYRVERHDSEEPTGTWYAHVEAYDGALEDYDRLCDEVRASGKNNYPNLDDYLQKNFLYANGEQVGISLKDGQIFRVKLVETKTISSTLTIAKITPLFQD